jgi:hypothetical protein
MHHSIACGDDGPLPDARGRAPGPGGGPARWRLRAAALLVLAVAAFGLAARRHLVASGLGLVRRESPLNVFYRLYALHERPPLLLLLLFAAVAWWGMERGAPAHPTPAEHLTRAGRRIPAWALALGVLAVTAAGTVLVMHDVGLSMDEYAASFQARIFAAGRLSAAIPAHWRGLAPWMTPIFVAYKPDVAGWVSTYLPVYAALRSAFVPLGLEWLLNPLLAAASVLLLDRIARRLWPGDDQRRVLALTFLVTSTQFLVTSMSGYSMPAHLCLNLLWLLLYLRGDRGGDVALPWVGVVAMGLHNPFPHALFAAPFLLRLLARRRFAWVAYMGAVYLAGAAGWLRWLRFAAASGGTGLTTPAGLLGSFALPNGSMAMVHGLNLTLLLSWQTPVLALLLVVALLAWPRLKATERDLGAGLLLTFAFYLLFPANQGHGWGYRYVYGALGNVVLLGAAGGALLARDVRRGALRTAIMASLLATVLIQLPLRLWQAESFVRPVADAIAFIQSRPVPLVAVDFDEGWYASDLVRNDPLFGRGPRVVAYRPGVVPPADAVPPGVRDSVYVLSRRDMARLGIPLLPPARPLASGGAP